MKNFTLALFLLSFITGTTFSQSYWIPKTPILDSLYNWEGSISEVSNVNSNQYFLPIDIKKSHTSQIIIKNNKGLYILVEGTGQVYQATQQTPRLIEFTRIDSTVYFGYNFRAINFSYNDSLFSYGGVGFWLINGHLRYFNDGKEWSTIEQPNVYPSIKILYNFLPIKSKLFFVQGIIAYKKLGNYEDNPDYSLIEINLATKKNKKIGKINELLIPLMRELDSYSFNTESLEGTILCSKDSYYLLRFNENKVYKLVSRDITDKFHEPSINGICNIFERNGLIYYYTKFDSSIHHFAISINDFQKEPYSLYQPLRNNSPIYYSIAGIIIIFTGILFVRKKLTRNRSASHNDETGAMEVPKNSMDFNVIETILIEQIIAKANKNELYTVIELNNALGLNKKSLEIQKKVRTETINRINHKFKVKYNKDTDLIERIRSEEDRRFYLYTISKENASLIGSKP